MTSASVGTISAIGTSPVVLMDGRVGATTDSVGGGSEARPFTLVVIITASTSWITLLGELTALAAGVALSPFSVIPAIALVVHSHRPRAVGLAFVAGWLAGKAAITAAFVKVPELLDTIDTGDASTPSWTGWVRIGLGLIALAAAFAYWRKPVAATMETPPWVERIKHVTPAVAAAVGVAMTVINVKVVLMCAAAGYVIGTRQLDVGAASLSIAYFTLVAGSSAAVPILAYSVWAERIDRYLEGFRLWMQRNQRQLTGGALVLIGVGLIVSGAVAL